MIFPVAAGSAASTRQAVDVDFVNRHARRAIEADGIQHGLGLGQIDQRRRANHVGHDRHEALPPKLPRVLARARDHVHGFARRCQCSATRRPRYPQPNTSFAIARSL